MSQDHDVSLFGYRQEFERTIRSFTSFAVAFSFISITTGIFTTMAFALQSGGPASIWTWPVVIVGQLCVALVFGALAAKIPLSGFSYQWASRLTNPVVGLFIGWLSYSFLAIVVISVDYGGFVLTAFDPLFNITNGAHTVFSLPGADVSQDVLITLGVLVVQALMIIFSTKLVELVNNAAVATEIIGIVGLTIALIIAVLVGSDGSFSNLSSTGIVTGPWFKWLGPVMLSTLLGAYTIVGFETAANLAEETHEPRRIVPRAMWTAVLYSGIIGMVFLIAVVVAMPTGKIAELSASSTVVADIIKIQLGNVIEKLFLIFVCISIFACGLIIYVSQGRLIWSMSRDERFPGYQVFRRVNHTTRTPVNAVVLGWIVAAILLIWFSNRVFDLFTASTQLPAMYYLATVLLYIYTRNRLKAEEGFFTLGKWEPLVVGVALVWLVYELLVVFGPSEFHKAAKYTIGMTLAGIVWIGLLWVFHRRALERMPELPDDPARAETAV
ncbi:MAG TPA: amino acid permease [Gaiellales bacterium]|nr:amino acid permease [Gaiellales bacterium]